MGQSLQSDPSRAGVESRGECVTVATPAAPRRSQRHVRTEPDETAELLRRMAAAEEEALVVLYARTAGLVHAVALRILGSREEAGDVTAEVFWRLWTRAGSFDPGHCSALAWILTVARRMALDRRRSLLRRGSAVERFRAESQGEPAEGGEEAMVSRVQAAAVLSRLSERDRSLLQGPKNTRFEQDSKQSLVLNPAHCL